MKSQVLGRGKSSLSKAVLFCRGAGWPDERQILYLGDFFFFYKISMKVSWGIIILVSKGSKDVMRSIVRLVRVHPISNQLFMFQSSKYTQLLSIQSEVFERKYLNQDCESLKIFIYILKNTSQGLWCKMKSPMFVSWMRTKGRKNPLKFYLRASGFHFQNYILIS